MARTDATRAAGGAGRRGGELASERRSRQATSPPTAAIATANPAAMNPGSDRSVAAIATAPGTRPARGTRRGRVGPGDGTREAARDGARPDEQQRAARTPANRTAGWEDRAPEEHRGGAERRDAGGRRRWRLRRQHAGERPAVDLAVDDDEPDGQPAQPDDSGRADNEKVPPPLGDEHQRGDEGHRHEQHAAATFDEPKRQAGRQRTDGQSDRQDLLEAPPVGHRRTDQRRPRGRRANQGWGMEPAEAGTAS